MSTTRTTTTPSTTPGTAFTSFFNTAAIEEQVKKYTPPTVYFDQRARTDAPYFKKKFQNPAGLTFKTMSRGQQPKTKTEQSPRPKHVDFQPYSTTTKPTTTTTTTTTTVPRYTYSVKTSTPEYAYSDKYTYFTIDKPSTTTPIPKYTYSINPSTPRRYTFKIKDDDKKNSDTKPVTELPKYTYSLHESAPKKYSYVIQTTTPKPKPTTTTKGPTTRAPSHYTYSIKGDDPPFKVTNAHLNIVPRSSNIIFGRVLRLRRNTHW